MAAAAEQAQLRSALLACTSIDARLSLYFSSQPHLHTMNEVQTNITCMKNHSDHPLDHRRGVDTPVAVLSLFDPRFLALLQRTRMLCQPSTCCMPSCCATSAECC